MEVVPVPLIGMYVPLQTNIKEQLLEITWITSEVRRCSCVHVPLIIGLLKCHGVEGRPEISESHSKPMVILLHRISMLRRRRPTWRRPKYVVGWASRGSLRW